MFTQALTITAALALSAAAQTTTSAATATGEVQTTITGLVGTYTTGFAASVVSANPCDTTLAMQCTDIDNYYCSLASDVELTVTQGPSHYEIQYSTSTLGGMVSISQSCSLNGPSGSASEMVCHESAVVSAAGQKTGTSTSTTLTNSDDFNYAQIPITAGAEKLPSAGASCTATQDSAGAAATSVSEVYKVIVPVGVALVGAILG